MEETPKPGPVTPPVVPPELVLTPSERPARKRGSGLFALMIIANVIVWGGFLLSGLLKPGGFWGGPVFWLDARYDPNADYAKGCGKRESRVGGVCVDQYEFPNRPGDLPKVLNTPEEARAACQSAGKRLCSFEEFKAACAAPVGEGDFPMTAASKACNVIFRFSDNGVRLMKSGEMKGCVNRHGLHDVAGNLAEWVEADTGPGLVGGSFGTEIGTNATCRAARSGGPGLGEGFRGVRCCRDAPPLAADRPG